MGYAIIYIVSGCPHCVRVKRVLQKKAAPYVEINIATYPERRQEMIDLTKGAKSVPQIFFNAEYIGDADDFFLLERNGQLDEKIREFIDAPPPAFPVLDEKMLNAVEEKAISQFHKELEERFHCIRREFSKSSKKKGFKGTTMLDFIVNRFQITPGEALDVCQALLENHMIYVLFSKNTPISSPSSACNVIYANDDSRYTFWDEHLEMLNQLNYCSLTKLNATEVVAQMQEKIGKLKDAFINDQGTGVNYSSMQNSPEFRDYVKTSCALQEVKLNLLSRDERLAFFINVYNALMVHGNIIFGPPRSALQRLTFFTRVAYNINGVKYTLDDLEHGLLRGNAKKGFKRHFQKNDIRLNYIIQPVDPRIHFALNCGAKSCPPIRVYTGENIDNELQLAAEAFCQQEIQIFPEKRKIKMSKLFAWYGCDFGKDRKAQMKNISKYLSAEQQALAASLIESDKYKVSYKDYDWESNDDKTATSLPLNPLLSPIASPPTSPPTSPPPLSPPISPPISPQQKKIPHLSFSNLFESTRSRIVD